MRRSSTILVLLFLAACSGVPLETPLATDSTLNSQVRATVTPLLASPTSTSLPPTDISSTTSAATATPALVPPTGQIANLPPDGTLFTWKSVASGLTKPVGLTNAGDGSKRVFVIEQSGIIRIIQDGVLVPDPFLDIRSRTGSDGSEQGLLGLAFHPNYAQNGYFYVNYTDLNGDTIIARFQVSPDNPNLADPNSEYQLLQINQPYANHNGGEVAFGPDGYLYLGLGDGGSAGDPQGNGQSLATLLGKILRVDVDQAEPYTIPSDNPFANGGGQPEIWAYGLRNPWRFSFDRQTGNLYIADVGQNAWEEINFLPSGSMGGTNFGWNFFEGSHPYQGIPQAGASFAPPIAEYAHDQGCSVTGGYVYRGSLLPELQGIYFYGDYCTGTVWGLRQSEAGQWQSMELFKNTGRISSFGEDEAGELYLVDHSGNIFILSRR